MNEFSTINQVFGNGDVFDTGRRIEYSHILPNSSL